MALTTENNSNNPNLKNLRKPTLELDEGLTVAGKNEYAEEDYTLEKDKTELTEPVQVAGLGKEFTKGLLKGASGVKETVSKGAKKVGETVDIVGIQDCKCGRHRNQVGPGTPDAARSLRGNHNGTCRQVLLFML